MEFSTLLWRCLVCNDYGELLRFSFLSETKIDKTSNYVETQTENSREFLVLAKSEAAYGKAGKCYEDGVKNKKFGELCWRKYFVRVFSIFGTLLYYNNQWKRSRCC